MTKKKVQNLLKHLVCILLCLTVILPFYMVVINSFKSKGEASRMSLALPKEWLFSNYTEVIDKVYFTHWLQPLLVLCSVQWLPL